MAETLVMASRVPEFSEAPVPFEGNSSSAGSSRLWLRVGAGGRIVIPAEMRTAMAVREGDALVASVVDGELRVISQDAAIRRAQALVRRHVPADASLVDELLEERRTDARREAET